MIQHQARRDNMADVAAKDGSQVSRTIFKLLSALSKQFVAERITNFFC